MSLKKNHSHRPALTVSWVSKFMPLSLLWNPQVGNNNKNGISDSSFPVPGRLEGTSIVVLSFLYPDDGTQVTVTVCSISFCISTTDQSNTIIEKRKP